MPIPTYITFIKDENMDASSVPLPEITLPIKYCCCDSSRWEQPKLQRQSSLPMSFPHRRHSITAEEIDSDSPEQTHLSRAQSAPPHLPQRRKSITLNLDDDSSDDMECLSQAPVAQNDQDDTFTQVPPLCPCQDLMPNIPKRRESLHGCSKSLPSRPRYAFAA